MTCEELKELYELYALGVLDAEERAEIEAHLARGCANCKQGLAHACALNTVLMSIGPTEAPSKKLRHRLLASIGYEKPGWFWTGALVAALMLVLAIWIGTEERERTNQLATVREQLMQMTGERDNLTQAVRFLSDPETRPATFGRGQQAPPRGYVFLHPQLGVMLIASNLPAAGQGKTYEMWVIPKTGAPKPAGLFQSDGTHGLHILSGPIDLDALNAVAVTLEPLAGSAEPTTKPIIVAPAGT